MFLEIFLLRSFTNSLDVMQVYLANISRQYAFITANIPFFFIIIIIIITYASTIDLLVAAKAVNRVLVSFSDTKVLRIVIVSSPIRSLSSVKYCLY